MANTEYIGRGRTCPPTQTPWGRIDIETQLAEGIWIVSTETHGGVWLSAARRRQLPEAVRKSVGAYIGSEYRRNAGEWAEEDCEAPLVLACFLSDLAPTDEVNLDIVREVAPKIAEAYRPALLPVIREAMAAA